MDVNENYNVKERVGRWEFHMKVWSTQCYFCKFDFNIFKGNLMLIKMYRFPVYYLIDFDNCEHLLK